MRSELDRSVAAAETTLALQECWQCLDLFLLDFRVNELEDEGAEMPLGAHPALSDLYRCNEIGGEEQYIDHKSEDVQF